MIIADIQKLLCLDVVAGNDHLDNEVAKGYCGDLLSDVMANADKGSLWVTIQGHQNVVAVAVLRDLAGIIMANGRTPDEETISKANEEGIPILLSSLPAFTIAGRLYESGLTTS